MKKPPPKLSTFSCLSMAAVFALGCPEPAVQAPPDPAIPVWVADVVVHDLEERVVVTGELVAKNEATVAAQVSGEITVVAADEGDPVRRGQIVMEIDPERRELDVARAEAQLAEAQAGELEASRELDRMQRLSRAQVAARADLEQAEAAVQSAEARILGAEAELGRARRELRDATVKAAFAGRISRRHANRGEFVKVGQSLFHLVSPAPLEVEFHLPEADASRLHEELSLEVEVAAYPEDRFGAVISMISPVVDPETRTLRVKAMLGNEDGRLRPGMFARADLGIETRQRVSFVPEAAVLQRIDGQKAFRMVGEDRVERVDIETGAIRGELVEIVSGLEVGDRVVRRGHERLVDGSAVRARERDGRDAAPPPSTAEDSP